MNLQRIVETEEYIKSQVQKQEALPRSCKQLDHNKSVVPLLYQSKSAKHEQDPRLQFLSATRYELEEESSQNSKSLKKARSNIGNFPKKKDFSQIMQSIKRVKLDEQIGMCNDLVKKPSLKFEPIWKSFMENQGSFHVFDLGTKKYITSNLQEVLQISEIINEGISPFTIGETKSFEEQQILQQDDPQTNQIAQQNHLVILMSNLNEQIMQQVFSSFNVNPLLEIEVMLKQSLDKIVSLDEDTVYYNIEIIKEQQINKSQIYKLLHLYYQNVLLIITDKEGEKHFIKNMNKLFLFEQSTQTEDKELQKQIEKSISDLELNQESVDSNESQSLSSDQMIKRDRGTIKYLTNQISCEDILYTIFDEALRKIEPIIYSFYYDEAATLNQLSMNLSHYEQLDFVRRTHMAKKILITMLNEINVKRKFYQQIDESEFNYNKLKIMIRLLKGRLENSDILATKSKQLIDLSNQTYGNIVDNGLNEHSTNLNRIMKALAALTVIFIPFQVLSAFFGMNVLVPFQGYESTIPFFVLMLVCAVVSAVLLISFRYLNWI